MTPLEVTDPSTGAPLRKVDVHSAAELQRRLDRAVAAQREWRATPPADRGAPLAAAAERLRADAAKWALLMAEEMGKPIAQGRAEAEKCAWVLEHFAQHGAALLGDEVVKTEARSSFVRAEPLGVILAIMPWNFPFWQVLRCAAPALAAGNGVALKHAETVPGCALALESIFAEVGLPEGLFTTLLVERARAPGLVADARIAAVALTGSDRAGAEVGAIAGRHLKKCVLELGGSDPFIVLDDADLDRAAEVGAKARCQNSGQSCIAAKRFIVTEAVAEAFVERFQRALAALPLGDPRLETTYLGPIARADLRENLHRQVRESITRGARVLLGGELPEGPGFFYPTTLLTSVGPGMPAWDEETFGPVAAVSVVAGDAEAIATANGSVYGLGASVWTRDAARADRFARELETGAVFVNEMVKSDPRLPFGGVKRSGHGRELSWHGLREFVSHKTVWIA